MSLIITESPDDYPLAPQGLWPCVIIDSVNLGELQTPWGLKHKVSLVFELEEEDENGKRYILGKRYTASLNEKANLRKDLERFRGKKFTVDELSEGVDLEELVGLSCQILIVHNETDERTYANVDSILPPPQVGKGQDRYHAIEPSGEYTRVVERPDYKPPEEFAKEVNQQKEEEVVG